MRKDKGVDVVINKHDSSHGKRVWRELKDMSNLQVVANVVVALKASSQHGGLPSLVEECGVAYPIFYLVC